MTRRQPPTEEREKHSRSRLRRGSRRPILKMKEGAVIRPMFRVSCFVALLVVAQLGLAQEFSADVLNTKDNGELKKL
jgi:hypothetical protein